MNKLTNGLSDIKSIKEKISEMKPSFSGNSRSCYLLQDYVALVETGDEKKLERTKSSQSFCNLLAEKGVNTASIPFVGLDNGLLYMVQDRMPGHPVYFRDERSYCMSRGLKLPSKQSKIDMMLRDEFFSKKGFSISDFFRLTREEKVAFNEELNLFKQDRIENDSSLKEEIEYLHKIDEEVKLQNEQYAKEYAKADQKHFDKFLKDLTILSSLQGSNIDCHSDNFLYDDKAGFSLVDIESSTIKENDRDFSGMSVCFMIDILTKGTSDAETQVEIISKCLTSAENLGIKLEDISCVPFNVAKSFNEAVDGYIQNKISVSDENVEEI